MSSKISELFEAGRKLTEDSASSTKVPLQPSSSLACNPYELAEQPDYKQMFPADLLDLQDKSKVNQSESSI